MEFNFALEFKISSQHTDCTASEDPIADALKKLDCPKKASLSPLFWKTIFQTQRPEDVKSLPQKICGFFATKMA